MAVDSSISKKYDLKGLVNPVAVNLLRMYSWKFEFLSPESLETFQLSSTPDSCFFTSPDDEASQEPSNMSSSKPVHQAELPDELKDHCFAKRYRYVNHDEELDVSLGRGLFYIDSLAKPFHTLVDIHEQYPDYDSYQAMNETTMEKGDYLLCCVPKTGQHWTWEIMNMLVKGNAEYTKSDKSSLWVDVRPLTDIYKEFPAPRVLTTHVTTGWLPSNFRRSDTKAVVTMRNLKDVFASWYFHRRGLKGAPETVWSDLLKMLMYSKYNVFGSYFDHYADVWDNARHDPNVMVVFYEDLKRKPEETIEKLAQHMEVKYTAELISSIANATHFSKMKPVKDAVGFHPTMNSSLYHSGEIGKWKTLFTDAQNEEFDRVWNDFNKDRHIPFIYE